MASNAHTDSDSESRPSPTPRGGPTLRPTGGALFAASGGGGGGALPQCILACVLDCLTLTDVARFIGVGASAQTEVTRYYAASTTLTVGSARELAGLARLDDWSGAEADATGRPPVALRVCASLRKLVVRNADARVWNGAGRAKQVASDSKLLGALLLRNSRTLTSLHLSDALNADVTLALRACSELAVLNAPSALPAMLRDGRASERWPQLRVATGVYRMDDMRTLSASVGLALTHIGYYYVKWAYEVVALVSHPLRVLEWTLDDKRGALQALHAPAADGCAAAAEELLRSVAVERSALEQWMLEDAVEEGGEPVHDPRAYAANVPPAAALAGQLRAFHASLTSVDLGNTGGCHLAGPLDGSVELPAGVWRLRARDDVLRYFGGARGLRVLCASICWAPAAAALGRVLRSLDRPDAFAVLELISTCFEADDAADGLESEGVESPRANAAAALLAASALTPALRVLVLDVACPDVSACIARLAAARAWPALRFLHLYVLGQGTLSAADAATALQAWPALVGLGAFDLGHFADRDEWLADPDGEACVARYLAHASRNVDPPSRAVSAACGGRFERLQLGVDARALADPLFHRVAPWNGSLPALTFLDLGLARASVAHRWRAVARIVASAPCLESLTLAFEKCADATTRHAQPDAAAGAVESAAENAAESAVGRAAALRSLTIRGSWCGAAARLLSCLPALRKLRLEFNDSDGRAEADLSRMRARLPADTRYCK